MIERVIKDVRRRERFCAWTGAVGLGVASMLLGVAAVLAYGAGQYWVVACVAGSFVIRGVSDFANNRAVFERHAMWSEAIDRQTREGGDDATPAA